MHKGLEEGQTPLSSESPGENQDMASSPSVSRSQTVAISYVTSTARSTYGQAVQQISKGGNEQLATTLNNVAGTIGFGIMAAKLPAAAALSAVNVGVSSITKELDRQRENKNKEFQRDQAGVWLDHNQRGASFD